jgi:hypothetical protein
MRRSFQVVVKAKETPLDSLRFWAGKTSAERVDAVSFLRRQCFAVMGFKELPRLRRDKVRARRG